MISPRARQTARRVGTDGAKGVSDPGGECSSERMRLKTGGFLNERSGIAGHNWEDKNAGSDERYCTLNDRDLGSDSKMRGVNAT